MKDKNAWLDTQTEAMLRGEPPQAIAPPTLPDFSLVVLESGKDQQRMVRAVRRVNDCSHSDAKKLLARGLPLVVNADLSHHDALLGQFEFVCCDAIAVFLRSRVAAGAEASYLKELFARLCQGGEFRDVTVSLGGVPRNEEGSRFLDQFLGLVGAEAERQQFPVELQMLYKKARIMAHWAGRIGGKACVMVGT
ncbi:MAG: hypothetical protein HQ582_02020 [Planctomycetes bacterium]|nr:hypothetical protein [Planctomycetota bacterium]